MRKWTAAAVLAAVLMVSGCKGKAPGGASGGAAAGGSGSSATASGGASATDEETVPGGFTVDTQKVENLGNTGTTVNEPD